MFSFDEDLSHNIDRFIDQIQNVLSSRKSLALDNSLKFKVKVMSETKSEMRIYRDKKNVNQRRWRKKHWSKKKQTQGYRGKASNDDKNPFIWPVPSDDQFDSYCVILSCLISIYKILAKEKGGKYLKSWNKLSALQWKKNIHGTYGKAITELDSIFKEVIKERPKLLEVRDDYERVIPILSEYFKTNIFVLTSKIECHCEFNYPSLPKHGWPSAYVHLEKVHKDLYHMNPIPYENQFFKKFRYFCVFCNKTYAHSKYN